MAKYLATSLAMLNVVSEPRVISSLLPDFDDLDELGRVAVQVDHVAGFARRLGAGVHGHAHVGLGQRRRVVGAVAGHGDQVALGLFLADALEFVLRRGLGDEIIHARFGGDGRGGQRIVAGDHHGADPHLAQLRKAFLDAAFDHVLEMDRRRALRFLRRPPAVCRRARDLIDGLADCAAGKLPPAESST